MDHYLSIAVHYTCDNRYRRYPDAGLSWPPTPMHLFPPLVQAMLQIWNQHILRRQAEAALAWLEQLPYPEIILDAADPSVDTNGWPANGWHPPHNSCIDHYEPYSPSLPHFISPPGSFVTKTAPFAGQPPGGRPAVPRTVRFLYLFDDDVELQRHRRVLHTLVQHVRYLGNPSIPATAELAILTPEQRDALLGLRWLPCGEGSVGWPCPLPRAGTLRHLLRYPPSYLNPLLPHTPAVLPDCERVYYRLDTYGQPRSWWLFEFRSPDGTRPLAYDPFRHTTALAGMLRHATAALAHHLRPNNWTNADINRFIHGHDSGRQPTRGPFADFRLAFIPLAAFPVTPRPALRYALITAPTCWLPQLTWLHCLDNTPLLPTDGIPPARLRLLPPQELWYHPRLRPYLQPSPTWRTCSPLVLPGYDDGRPQKTDILIRRAFLQAGFPEELTHAAQIEWYPHDAPWSAAPARLYRLPDIPQPRPSYHVQVTWPRAIAGPMIVGALRYRGFGVFAAACGTPDLSYGHQNTKIDL